MDPRTWFLAHGTYAAARANTRIHIKFFPVIVRTDAWALAHIEPLDLRCTYIYNQIPALKRIQHTHTLTTPTSGWTSASFIGVGEFIEQRYYRRFYFKVDMPVKRTDQRDIFPSYSELRVAKGSACVYASRTDYELLFYFSGLGAFNILDL